MPKQDADGLQYRSKRLQTFTEGVKIGNAKSAKQWTQSSVDVSHLADLGFYYSPARNLPHQVTCFWCGKKEKNLENVASVADFHLANSPECPYAMIASTLEKFIMDSEKETFWQRLTEKYQQNHLPASVLHPHSISSCLLRQLTFKKLWKFDKSPKSKASSRGLAKAGFYYSPLDPDSDRVICMYCDCPLEEWDASDDPLEEHKNNLFTYCYFLKTLGVKLPKLPKLPKVKPAQKVENTEDISGVSEVLKDGSENKGEAINGVQPDQDIKPNEIEQNGDIHSTSLDSPMNLSIRHQDIGTPSPNNLHKAATPSDFDAFDFSVEDLQNHDVGTIFNDKKVDDKKSQRKYQRRRGGEPQVNGKKKHPDTGMSLVLEIRKAREEDSESIEDVADLSYLHDDMLSDSLRDKENSSQKEESKISAYEDSVVPTSFDEEISEFADLSFDTSTNAETIKAAKTQKKRKGDVRGDPVPKKQKSAYSSDELGLDQEQLEEILNSPRKGRKMTVIRANKDFSPPHDIYDLSNQNIGDYEEENISFLERNIKLKKEQATVKNIAHEISTPKEKGPSEDVTNSKITEKKKGKKSLQAHLDEMFKEDSRTFDKLKQKAANESESQTPAAPSVSSNILGDDSVPEISANFPSTSTPTKENASAQLDVSVHEEELNEMSVEKSGNSDIQRQENNDNVNMFEKEVDGLQEEKVATKEASNAEIVEAGAPEGDSLDDDTDRELHTLRNGEQDDAMKVDEEEVLNDPMEVERYSEQGYVMEDNASGLVHEVGAITEDQVNGQEETANSSILSEKLAHGDNISSMKISDPNSSVSKRSPEIEKVSSKFPAPPSVPRVSAFDSDSFEIPNLSSDNESQDEADNTFLHDKPNSAVDDVQVEAREEITLIPDEIKQDDKEEIVIQEDALDKDVEVPNVERKTNPPSEEMVPATKVNGLNNKEKEELQKDAKTEEIKAGEAVSNINEVESYDRHDDSKQLHTDMEPQNIENVVADDLRDQEDKILMKREDEEKKEDNGGDKVRSQEIEDERIEEENIEDKKIEDDKIEVEDERIQDENNDEQSNEGMLQEENIDQEDEERSGKNVTEGVKLEVDGKHHIDERIEEEIKRLSDTQTMEYEVEDEKQTKLQQSHNESNNEYDLANDKHSKVADSTLNLDEPSELKELNLSPSSYQAYVNDMKDIENDLIEENEQERLAKQEQKVSAPSFVEDSASELLALSTQSPIKGGSPEIDAISEVKETSERKVSASKGELSLSSEHEYHDSSQKGDLSEGARFEIIGYSEVEKSPSPPSYVVADRRFPISSPRKLASSAGEMEDHDFTHSSLKRLSFADIEASTPQKNRPVEEKNESHTTPDPGKFDTSFGRADPIDENADFAGSDIKGIAYKQPDNNRSRQQRTKISHVDLDIVATEMQTLLDTIEYLAEVSATQRELHNDAEGILTQFIATMPEEEEGMSIREWIEHNATTCGRTVREISERVVRAYEDAFDQVIERVDQMDTVD